MHVYVQKDRAADQVYIGLGGRRGLRRGSVKKTIRATDDIALDFDGADRLLGIDVSRASKVLGRQVFAEGLAGEELLGVAEAARLYGVRKPNFLRDVAIKPGFPKPVASLAGGRVWLRSEIEAYLRGAGHGANLRHIA